jgi:hypothetical protein
LTSWKKRRAVLGTVAVAVLGLTAVKFFPPEIRMSPYKKLTLEKLKPQTRVIDTTHGPLGRIDILQGRSIHDAPPGMSLQNPHPIPSRSLVIIDGDRTHVVYNFENKEDLRFLNYTSTAVAFAVGAPARLLIIGPGGGAPLSLAQLNAVENIDAVAANRQMVELIQSRLVQKGGSVYRLPGVRTYFESPRGYLQRTKGRYDLILLPLLDSAGTGGAGLQAAQENYLFTVQSLRGFIRHLTEKGLVCITVGAKTPPRDGLRIFNTAITALQQEGLAPAGRLALIRSWETVTLVAQKTPWTENQLKRIHDFCDRRGFDVCYLPGLRPEAVNRFHVLSRPFYYEGAQELLGMHRQHYIENYLFALEAPTDDRPYFDHFIRWRHLPELKRQLKGRMPAFLELGSLLMAIALVQVGSLAVVLIFLPLLPGLPVLRRVGGKRRTLVYFCLLGVGFMLLEMGFLQKMIVYLAHPIYSAAAVIAAFLISAGIGSLWSARRNHGTPAAARAAALLVTVIGLCYLFWLDPWLALTQGWDLLPRLIMTTLTIAPLALAMGHLFPLGLRRVGEAAPALVPWCWAANGFASVIATVSAPLLAMSVGFSKLILAAIVCYLAAGLLFSHLPQRYAAN